MKKITWDNSYSVGVRMLDDQHREIIDVVNLLIMDPYKNVNSDTVQEALMRLKKFALEHFETEEMLLELHGYPDYAAHKQEHNDFTEALGGFCMDTLKERPEVPKKLMLFVRDWWDDHILVEDMKFSTFLKQEVSHGGG